MLTLSHAHGIFLQIEPPLNFVRLARGPRLRCSATGTKQRRMLLLQSHRGNLQRRSPATSYLAQTLFFPVLGSLAAQ